MRQEKTAAMNSGSSNFNEHKKYNQSEEKPQLNFNFGNQPPKVFQTITCHDCKESREFAGYRFALVAVCDCCRIESEVLITRKRFERREAKR